MIGAEFPVLQNGYDLLLDTADSIELGRKQVLSTTAHQALAISSGNDKDSFAGVFHGIKYRREEFSSRKIKDMLLTGPPLHNEKRRGVHPRNKKDLLWLEKRLNNI